MKTKLRQSINATFRNGIWDIIIKGLTTGPLLTTYAVSFGIGNIMLGFLQSVIPFSNLVHLLVSVFLEKGKSPKKIACLASVLSRPLLAVMALSFFFHGSSWGIFTFIISYCLFYFMTAITAGAFWPWCKELIPQKIVTSFFAFRIRYILLVKILTVTGATSLIAFVNNHYSHHLFFTYSFFCLVAFIAGIFYTYNLFQIQDLPLKIQPEISFHQKINSVLKNKQFLSFFLNLGSANFALSFFIPFCLVFLLRELRFSVPVAMLFSIGSNCVDILFINFWKRYAHQKTLGKMLSNAALSLALSAICLACVPFYEEEAYLISALAFTFIGIGNSGMNLAISDASVSYVPSRMSSIYISLMNIGRFSFAGMGSFSAGIILDALEICGHFQWSLFFIFSGILLIWVKMASRKITPIDANN